MPDPDVHVGDEWEPRDDEDAAEVAVKEPTMTAEETATLKALKDTGMPLAELTARARRDVQTEQQGQQTRPQPVAAPAGAAADASDPDSILTRAEAEKLIHEAATTAKDTAVQASVQTRLQEVVDREIASTPGFGDLVPDDEVLLIKNRVGATLMAKVRFAELSKGELDREVRRITTEVLAKKRKEARQMADADQEGEAQRRVQAQREAAPVGVPGSSGKRSAQTAPESSARPLRFDPDNPRFGLGVEFPTGQEIDERADVEVDEYFRKQSAGR